jgi:drug/metabolite transporter (DMT)-like permease
VLRLGLPGVRVGVLAGLALAAGYALQTLGLLSTPASISGFLTGLFVVLAPVGAAVLLRERLTRPVLASVVVATAGLALLSLRGLSVGPGEALTLACAVAFAVHLVALGRWSPRYDVHGLVVVQLVAVTVVCAVLAVPGGVQRPPDLATTAAVVATAVGATALGYFAQTWAQARLSVTRSAVILTTEPVFACLAGIAFTGEQFGWRTAVGGSLVLVAMLLATVGARGAGGPVAAAPVGRPLELATPVPRAALAPRAVPVPGPRSPCLTAGAAQRGTVPHLVLGAGPRTRGAPRSGVMSEVVQ